MGALEFLDLFVVVVVGLLLFCARNTSSGVEYKNEKMRITNDEGVSLFLPSFASSISC